MKNVCWISQMQCLWVFDAVPPLVFSMPMELMWLSSRFHLKTPLFQEILQKASAQRASVSSGGSNRSTTCGRLASFLTWLCIVGTLCSTKTSDHGRFSPPPDTSEDITLRQFGTFEILSRDAKTLEVQHVSTKRCLITTTELICETRRGED
ncbi:uncharacterized protein ACWYII_031012 isoform 2-T6 [Salvelinus alpinus]